MGTSFSCKYLINYFTIKRIYVSKPFIALDKNLGLLTYSCKTT